MLVLISTSVSIVALDSTCVTVLSERKATVGDFVGDGRGISMGTTSDVKTYVVVIEFIVTVLTSVSVKIVVCSRHIMIWIQCGSWHWGL